MKCSGCGFESTLLRTTEHLYPGPLCPACAHGVESRKLAKQEPKYPQYRKVIQGWCNGAAAGIEVDVYGILVAFNVTNPATAHAVKKALRAGSDHNDILTDLQEAKDALDRAMEIERGKA